MAHAVYTKAIKESEIDKIDLTDMLYKEIEIAVKNFETINWTTNGRVRLGKSTINYHFSKYTFDMMKKYQWIHQREKYGLQNLARDDQEASMKLRDPNYSHTVLWVDEKDYFQESGENATAEINISKTVSFSQAARYIHMFTTCPEDQYDPVSDLILEVRPPIRKQMITPVRVAYKYTVPGEGPIPITIGMAYIDVSKEISNWVKNVQPIFHKKHKTAQEKEYIRQQAEKDFYVKYNILKMKRFDLLLQEGVTSARRLLYADCALSIVEDLKGVTTIPRFIDAEMIGNLLEAEYRNRKLGQSIVGLEMAKRRALGILRCLEKAHMINKKITSAKIMQTKAIKEGNEQRLEQIKDEILLMEDQHNKMLNAYKTQVEELEKQRKVNQIFTKEMRQENEQNR